jgi:hypothetical protein
MHWPLPLHDATPSQTSSLSQSAPAPLAGFAQPPTGSQLSNVQGLPSTQLSACPRRTPVLTGLGPLQTLPSEHDVPFGSALPAAQVPFRAALRAVARRCRRRTTCRSAAATRGAAVP